MGERQALEEAKKHSDNFHGTPFDDGFHCGWQARVAQEPRPQGDDLCGLCPCCTVPKSLHPVRPVSGELRERAWNWFMKSCGNPEQKEWTFSIEALAEILAAFAASEREKGRE